jgi:hypothetical protein
MASGPDVKIDPSPMGKPEEKHDVVEPKTTKVATRREKRGFNDWTIGVISLFFAVVVAYLVVLAGTPGPLSAFRPDLFFTVVVVPVSITCLLCGVGAFFARPHPNLLTLILVIFMLVVILVQLCCVIISASTRI